MTRSEGPVYFSGPENDQVDRLNSVGTSQEACGITSTSAHYGQTIIVQFIHNFASISESIFLETTSHTQYLLGVINGVQVEVGRVGRNAISISS
jgi:hypothetical protein